MPLASGLYRTTLPLPEAASEIRAGQLVFVGTKDDGTAFVVVPHINELNRWFWREPVHSFSESWGKTLTALPPEGFYTLPKDLEFDSGGRWLKNAIVQLGYDRTGSGIIFVGERREGAADNALYFSAQGHRIEDSLLRGLLWAPILPVGVTEAVGLKH